MSVHIQCRTFDHTCYLASHDVARALRHRADEVEQQALGLGNDMDTDTHIAAVAYHCIARELRQRADAIDFGVIAHLTDEPGDSPTS